ncbi:hypothetical protein [Amycolatopsis australiensis]|uniref:Uncharacterized protein n=1 Tax=Amycolatopsis australiensis TaxID=546364 RepID=A0A1K1S0D4_9PSEU|nr:hypothetical protein [Amycolatopsis australiensis]SFW77774.1 hypothetical protein SAMN04489730_4380 [Amycolatopsis australiensis]
MSETFGRLLDPAAEHARTAGYCHGWVLEQLARYEDAEAVLAATMAAGASTLGPSDPETLVTAAHLAVRHARGKLTTTEAGPKLLPQISRKYAETTRSVKYVRRAIASLTPVGPVGPA